MAIDLGTELDDLLPLSEAAKLIPSTRAGKMTHRSTLGRFIRHGVKFADGTVVKLEAVRIGRWGWAVTPKTVREFLDRLTRAAVVPAAAAEPELTSAGTG